MCRRIGESISLVLFYFVNLTISCHSFLISYVIKCDVLCDLITYTRTCVAIQWSRRQKEKGVDSWPIDGHWRSISTNESHRQVGLYEAVSSPWCAKLPHPTVHSLAPGLSPAGRPQPLTPQPACGSSWSKAIVHSGIGFFRRIVNTNF